MIVIYQIGKYLLRFVYFFMKLFKTKDRILLISRQSNEKSIDFVLLEKEFKKYLPNYEVMIFCKTIDNGIINKLKYMLYILKQAKYIATSRVVILDSYSIPISILNHKKDLIVIQMWHAMGAFKKFGKSIIGKDEANINSKRKNNSTKIANIFQMHNNYDYIFASSEYSIKYFAEAFGYPLSKFSVFALPRLDLIIDKNNYKRVSNLIYKKYPKLKNKKNVLYCPTFRKDKHDYNVIKELIEEFDYSKYNLIVKLHPLTKYKFENKNAIFDYDFQTYEMGFVANIVITDYSAIIYEIALLKKPIYFYAYDKEKYVNARDFYLNYDKDMPGIICKDKEELFNSIDKKYDYNKLNNFIKLYLSKCNISYASDIVLFVKKLLNRSENDE